MFGNKNAEMLNVHQRDPHAFETLARALAAPSLYDEVLRLLSRRGYGIPEDYLARDFSEPYRASKQVAGAWLGVYHNADKGWDLYELAERLVDLDHNFQLWRCHHLKTVERIIGYKPGTGGTGGVSYLAKALELKFFPELWQIRTVDVKASTQRSGVYPPTLTGLIAIISPGTAASGYGSSADR